MLKFDTNPENAPLTQGSELTQNGLSLVQRKTSFPYNALSLNGTSQSAQVSGFKLLGTEGYSVCVNYKASPGTTGMLVCRQNDDNSQWSSWVTNGKLYFGMSIGSTWCHWATVDSDMTDGTWKKIVLNYNRDNTASLFVNGVAKAIVIHMAQGSLVGVSAATNITPVSIGYRTYPGYPTRFTGQIAFAGIAYGQDLTADATELHAKKTWDEFSPALQSKFVAFYELANWRGHFGKEYIDRAGKSGPLVPSGVPSFVSSGLEMIDSGKDHTYLYNAATLTGTEYFSHPNFPQLGTQDLSIAFSFKSNIGNAGTGMLVTRQDNGNLNYWSVYLSLGRIAVELSVNSGTGNNLTYVTGNGLADNNRHTVVLYINRASSLVTIFVDGVAVPVTASVAGNVTGNFTSSIEMQIGRRAAPGYEYPLAGQIAFVGIAYGQNLTLDATALTKRTTWSDLSPSLKAKFIAFYELANWHDHEGFELLDRTGLSGAMLAQGAPTFTPAKDLVLDNYNGTEVAYVLKMRASHGIDNLQGRQSTVTAVGGISANGATLNGHPSWYFDNVNDAIQITGTEVVDTFNKTEWHVFAVFKHLAAESFGPLFTVSNFINAYSQVAYMGFNPRDSDITNSASGLFLPTAAGGYDPSHTLNDTTDIGNNWHIVHVFRRGNRAGFSYDNGPEVTFSPSSSFYASYDTIGIGAMFRQIDGISGNSFANLNVADFRVVGFLTAKQEQAAYQDLLSRYFNVSSIPYSARVIWQVGDLVDRSQSAVTPLVEGVAPTPVNIISPNPGLYFNGVNQTTRWAISSMTTFDHHDFTVFLVANSAANTADGGISWSMSNSTTSGNSIQLYISNVLYSSRSMLQAETPPGLTNTYGNGSQVVTAGKTHVYRFRVTPTTLYLSIDGQVEVALAANISGQLPMTRISLACYAVPTPVYFDELTVYEHSVVKNASVTMEQLQLESLRLKNKYKI